MLSVNEKAVKKLLEKNLTISSAESCTGGMFVKLITDVSGSSAILAESYVTYANEAKTKILGVNRKTLEKYGAVSQETAKEMVSGLFKVTNAKVCVVFTGIAGPGGGTKEKPVGLVYVGIGYDGEDRIYKLNLDGTRDEVRTKACEFAFNKILELI